MEEKSTCKTNSYGDKRWYLNGKLHRENDLPAIEYIYGFYKAWYMNDMHHRPGGAAREWANGNKEWWLNDKLIDCKTQKEFEHYMKYKAFL